MKYLCLVPIPYSKEHTVDLSVSNSIISLILFVSFFFHYRHLNSNRLKSTGFTAIISISNFLNNPSQFIFLTVHHNRAYTVSVGLKYTDCFTAVVDKVKTLIKTVCCLFAVGLRRVNGRRESWQLRKVQGSPAFQHIVLVSDSARRESSARSGAGSIGWVVHLLKPSYSFFLLSIIEYLLGT